MRPSNNVQRFRGGLVFEAHRFFVLLNSTLESDKEEKRKHAKSKLISIVVLALAWQHTFNVNQPFTIKDGLVGGSLRAPREELTPTQS